ncbi:MAG: long-chain fatty acid--CoA ligase [Acetobacteraceae bacterium]|nr:long-chain fatty acid--CoA ligase [Acetobacteraceae bacterium]
MLETVPWASELRGTVDAHGASIAVHDGTQGISFHALADRASQVAYQLLFRGMRPGEPVVSSLRNSIPAVWTSVGLRISGAAEVALNASLTDTERKYCVDLVGVKWAVTTAAQADIFRALGCDVIVLEELPKTGETLDLPSVPAEAWSRIGFTSGTTGKPKAIVTTHGARWIANILQRAHFSTMPGPGSAILLMTPFVHGAGILAHGFNDRGATAYLLDGVEIEKVSDALHGGKVDYIFAPPTVMAKIVVAFEGEVFPNIRTIFTGTAPLTAPLYYKARKMFGPVIRVTYGKSEITNPITVLSPEECKTYYAEPSDGDGVCVGYPGSGVEIDIRDDTNQKLPRGDVGEVHLRGRHMSCGHLDANGFQPLPPDGFHATGDLGRIDPNGRLHLVGRVADVIKSGGYKIHPDEIERVLAATAPVVSIVTLPSEYWGEVIVAVAEGADTGWEDRARAALGELARYKHPRAFLTMAELPRNHQGKIMRRLIREALLEAYTIQDGPYPSLKKRSASPA